MYIYKYMPKYIKTTIQIHVYAYKYINKLNIYKDIKNMKIIKR